MSLAESHLENYDVTLYKLAREQLDLCKGDQTKAIAQLTDLLLRKENRHLFKELVATVVLRAASASVRQITSDGRRHVLDPSHGRSQVTNLARGLVAAFLDFPLPGGIKLQDATRTDVITAAAFYEQRGSDMMHKARWLQLAAQSIPEGKLAGDVLTNERLTELWQESTNDRV